MMVKKFVCVLAIVCLAFALVACGGGSVKVDMDTTGSSATSNGGALVETGDYVYFINGVESYSTAYKTGDVVKGALARVKKSDVAENSSEKSEVVVSKLLVSGDKTAGIYIYGDYVYYAVPSEEKDSKGSVKSDKLNFFRTKLDGTSTSSKISNVDFASDASFRFVKSGDKVYLVVYSSSLYVFDTESCKQVYSYEKTIDEVLFDDNGADGVYFTIKPVNTNLYDEDSSEARQVSYQDVHKVVFGNEVKDEVVLSGAGKYIVTGDKDIGKELSGDGEGFTGVTIDLIKHKDGVLYFSYTSLDTTVGGTFYVALDDDKISADSKETWTNAKEAIINYGDKNASAIFGTSAYYLAKDGIIFVDSTYGILKYDYTAREDSDTDFGVKTLYYSETAKTATIVGVNGDYLYFTESNNVYRVNMKEENAEQVRLNKISVDTSWYAPELFTVGENDYVAVVYTDSNYKSYIYLINATETEKAYKEATDEDKETFYDYEATYETVSAVAKTMLGKMSESDAESFGTYLEGLKEDK